MGEPVLLRALLKDRHWQTYRAFCTQYDRAAEKVDGNLIGSYPSRTQLHRWTAGDLKGLPYPHHCQILEAMFPGVTAAQMFEPMPEQTARPVGVTSEIEDILGPIARGLDEPGAPQAGWGSPSRYASPPGDRSNIAFPIAAGASDTNGDPLVRTVARSVLAVGQELRMTDVEIEQLVKLAGHIVELELTVSIDIGPDGWSTITYKHKLLNLTAKPMKRLTRELWFETTTDEPLVIEPSTANERDVTIQRTHDTKTLCKFACRMSPGIEPGEVATISYACRGGQFIHDHYWRQMVSRYTRHLNLNIRHRDVQMLLNCTALEEQADGSDVSATDDLRCTVEDGDALMSLTRDYLQPSQAVTLRWEVTRAIP